MSPLEMRARRLSPSGRGALTVVAVTGLERDGAPRLRDGRGRALRWPALGEVRVGWLGAPGQPLDQVVAVGTQEGVELQLHGGEAVWRALRTRLQACGATWDEPPTPKVPGSLAESRARASAIHGELARLWGLARAALDRGACSPDLAEALDAVRARRVLGRRLARPAVVALVGRPNAGKSTLFNAMLGRQRALTSPIAGTTRDRVTALLTLRGIPVELHDTAGGSPLSDLPGDLLVHVLSDPHEDPGGDPRVMAVQGRSDLHGRSDGVSGRTGHGVAELLDRIAERLGLSDRPEDHVLAPIDPAWEHVLDGCGALADAAGDGSR